MANSLNGKQPRELWGVGSDEVLLVICFYRALSLIVYYVSRVPWIARAADLAYRAPEANRPTMRIFDERRDALRSLVGAHMAYLLHQLRSYIRAPVGQHYRETVQLLD